MTQDKIWQYFQGDGISNFDDAITRLRYLVRRARRLVSTPTPMVLNIGIGNGFLEQECILQGWQVAALDPDKAAVQKISDLGIAAHCGYIEDMPFNSGRFDVVFCSEVLEHLSDDTFYLGLREIFRVLKPSGFLVGTVPYREVLREGTVVCPDCGKRFHRWGHYQSFDIAQIKAVLNKEGFLPLSVRTYAFPVYNANRKLNGVRQALRWVLGILGSTHVYCNIVFIAKKAHG